MVNSKILLRQTFNLFLKKYETVLVIEISFFVPLLREFSLLTSFTIDNF